MSKAFTKKIGDELRPEYDLAQLKGGVRGKYYKRAIAGTNLVLIEPDLAKAFPDADSVNQALRILLDAARESRRLPARPNTYEAPGCQGQKIPVTKKSSSRRRRRVPR